MKQVVSTEKNPIKVWADIEDNTLEQAKNAANLPFIFKHIALMADSHFGYSVPIGSVIATEGAIIPAAIGFDINCGMIALKTSLPDITKESLKKIMGGSKEYKGGIRSRVPVGLRKQSKKQKDWLTDKEKSDLHGWSIIEKEYSNSLKQLGTLGGGR